MSKKLIVVVWLAICIVGCGQIIGVPSATNVPVALQNIVGIWSRQDTRAMKHDAPDITYTLTIQLKGDSTYVQTLNLGTGAPPITHTGTWAMNGPHITLANVLVESWDFDQGSWRPQQEQWWFVDDPGSTITPPIALFGGLKSAMETYGKFTKIR